MRIVLSQIPAVHTFLQDVVWPSQEWWLQYALGYLGFPGFASNIRCGVSLRQANSYCVGNVITAATVCLTVPSSMCFLTTGMKWSALPQQSCDSEPRSMALGMRLATLHVEADPTSSQSGASPKWAGWAAVNFKDLAGSRWGMGSRKKGISQKENKNWQLTFGICNFQFRTVYTSSPVCFLGNYLEKITFEGSYV